MIGEAATQHLAAVARSVGHLSSRLPANDPASQLWSMLPRRNIDLVFASSRRIVTADTANPAHIAFDILRTRVLRLCKENGWTTIAITSPTAGCGKTVVGINLAFSLARVKGVRTVLVDLDLRKPQIAATLNLHIASEIADFLGGRKRLEEVFARYGDNLAIAGNSRPASAPAELLHSVETPQAIERVRQALSPDLIIFDLPPMMSSDDVMAFLPHVDCAILVVAAEMSDVKDIAQCEAELARETDLLGIVLNKCRHVSAESGY